jgi:metallo-beta-lactamase family protein
VNPPDQLEAILAKAKRQSSVVLVPSFAVGRTQSLLLYLWTLKKAGRLPDMPVYVDSPMATDVTALYAKYATHHQLEFSQCKEAFGLAHYVQTTGESKDLSTRKGPMIIISASGMATGGRILHHLKTYAPDPDNFILLAGHQAAGTRGAFLAQGLGSIKIYGEYVKVAAEVIQLENVSAHADGDEMVAWLKPSTRGPKVYITHGEPMASEALREKLMRELGWECLVPAFKDSVNLD